MSFGTQPCFPEPILGKFLPAIRHVLPAKNSQLQHFFGSQLGLEARVKIFSGASRESVAVALLHLVVDGHGFGFGLFHPEAAAVIFFEADGRAA